jgi:hypothetical protein
LKSEVRSFILLAFLRLDTKILMISSVSCIIPLNFSNGTNSASVIISNQYNVSLASLRAISYLLIKSLVDWADLASLQFAPMEVPALNN